MREMPEGSGEPLPCCWFWLCCRVCMLPEDPPLVVVKDESAVKLLYIELLLSLLDDTAWIGPAGRRLCASLPSDM